MTVLYVRTVAWMLLALAIAAPTCRAQQSGAPGESPNPPATTESPVPPPAAEPAAPKVPTTDEPFISLNPSDFVDWCDDTMCIMPATSFYYNRVDGILYFLGVQYLNDRKLHPRLRAMKGWTSARGKDEYFQIDFEQPLQSQDAYSLGVSFYDRTAWEREDDEATTDFANNLRAFGARYDHRDYFRRDGMTIFAQAKPRPGVVLRLEYRNDALSSLETQQSVWSVFRRDDDWQENPPLTVGHPTATGAFEGTEFEGRMKSYVGSVVYDARDEFQNTGWLLRSFVEAAGGGIGGDYKFRKYVVDGTYSFRLSDTRTLDLAGAWGIASGTDYPSHKLFTLGGEQNLRGYDRKAFVGKSLLFARAEYGIQIWSALRVIYFFDTGEVWYGTTGFESSKLKSDFGIGFRFDAPGVGDLRVDVARAATTEEADVMIDFQLFY
jgi:outer membrane protein assembly factor BamA